MEAAEEKGFTVDTENFKAYMNAQKELARKNRKIVPRKLKSDADMYRDLSDDELDAVWNTLSGDYHHRLMHTDYSVGWELLSNICKERQENLWKDIIFGL